MQENARCATHFQNVIIQTTILIVFTVSFLPSTSFAIPAFARKYDLSCTSCHTKPPRLNAFGEAFHMAGFQIPQTKEGEIRKKRRIGRIYSETNFLNIFALRATGSFLESYSGGDPPETDLTLPQKVELYFAGTFTQSISYFFNFGNETDEIEGTDNGFEKTSRFGLGNEFFFMFNLDPSTLGMSTGGMGGAMIMGPMIMVGKIDPSTNFSYPTNRQLVLNSPGRIDAGAITRFSLTPYAFASKFFGMKTAGGNSIEVTKEILYNTAGDFGLDVHAMVGMFMFQAGVMQGISSGTTDVNEKKDPYLMARVNFGDEKYFSGSFSGLVNWGNDTAKVGNDLIDWFRYGFAGNVKYKLLDIYGAFIWDTIHGLPGGIGDTFDDTAFGMTLEGDYLLTDKLLLSLRYDQMAAGGFVSQKADGKVVTVQSRCYVRDNFSLFLRDSYNVENVSSNALQNFRNLVVLGVDFDF